MRYTVLVLAAALTSLVGCHRPPAPTVGQDAVAASQRVVEQPGPAVKRASDLLGMQLDIEDVKRQRALTLYNLATEKAVKALDDAEWDKAILHANEAAGVVDEHRDALWGTEITEFRAKAAELLAAAQERRRIYESFRNVRQSRAGEPLPGQPAAEVTAAEKRREIRMLREEARSFAQNRRFIEAIDALKQLLAIDPGNVEAQAELRRLEHVTGLRTYGRVREMQAREASGVGGASREALVPYGGTVTYPADWVETARQRQ